MTTLHTAQSPADHDQWLPQRNPTGAAQATNGASKRIDKSDDRGSDDAEKDKDDQRRHDKNQETDDSDIDTPRRAPTHKSSHPQPQRPRCLECERYSRHRQQPTLCPRCETDLKRRTQTSTQGYSQSTMPMTASAAPVHYEIQSQRHNMSAPVNPTYSTSSSSYQISSTQPRPAYTQLPQENSSRSHPSTRRPAAEDTRPR